MSIEQRVITIASEHSGRDVSPVEPLFPDLLDSLEAIEFALALEDEFEIAIDDGMFSKAGNCREIAALIRAEL